MRQDLRFLSRRVDPSPDVIETVLAAGVHHDRAARPHGIFDRQVNLVGPAMDWADGTDRSVHNHDRARPQA
jgi:hypothetical protein